MVFDPIRWLGRNLGTLLLAFTLAVVVWVSAVVTNDPNEVSVFGPVQIDRIGQADNLILINDIPNQARLTLKAPRTVLENLNNRPSLVHAWVDLSGYGPGTHTVPVRRNVEASPVRILEVDPDTVEVTLENRITRQVRVDIVVNGEPPSGYKKGNPSVSPQQVAVTGPESVVDQVALARATLDVPSATETVRQSVPVEIIDQNGEPVSGVSVNPKVVTVTQPITLVAGFKNVVVKVVTEGQPANGYRLTNISPTPPNVIVTSDNPDLINQMPGYVETEPLTLTGLNDDADFRLELNLPPGVSLVGEQSILVQVGIAAIEGSLTVPLAVEPVGLPPELQAQISPPIVDVIVTGPLPLLDTLSSENFRAVVDLSDLSEGTYYLSPVIDLVPDQVEVQSMLPQTVEITILPRPTPTPTSAATPSSNTSGGNSMATPVP